MISITEKQIDEALSKVELKNGLDKYLWIQSEVTKRNVSKDREFQKKFNTFYRIRRNSVWQKQFYSLLQKSKNGTVTFESTLSKLSDMTGRMESSFSSKLVTTINPKMPIIDSIVLKNLKLKLPYSYEKERKAKILKIYQILVNEFSLFLKTENGKYLVARFVKNYPACKISKTKMLDLILWQTRNRDN